MLLIVQVVNITRRFEAKFRVQQKRLCLFESFQPVLQQAEQTTADFPVRDLRNHPRVGLHSPIEDAALR